MLTAPIPSTVPQSRAARTERLLSSFRRLHPLADPLELLRHDLRALKRFLISARNTSVDAVGAADSSFCVSFLASTHFFLLNMPMTVSKIFFLLVLSAGSSLIFTII